MESISSILPGLNSRLLGPFSHDPTPPTKIKLQSSLANVQIIGAVKHCRRRLSLLVLGGVEGMEEGGVGVFTPF